jgi:hypothetical protein
VQIFGRADDGERRDAVLHAQLYGARGRSDLGIAETHGQHLRPASVVGGSGEVTAGGIFPG